MFTDRVAAGRELAQWLGHLAGEDVVVLGLLRGGVPVAAEVARALGAPLDVILVRKLGVPYQPELAMGALGEGGVRVMSDDVVRRAGVTAEEITTIEARERAELERRAHRFREGRPARSLRESVALIVDDGIATGATARAACQVARAAGAARVVLAVPVAPPDWTARLGDVADEFVSVSTPEPFYAVGQFYGDFSQTTDDEVVRCLAEAHAASSPSADADADDPPVRDEDVAIPTRAVALEGHLTVPERPQGVVVFVHGSGSSRHSPRNRYVAEVLNEAGLATLLFDLLTPAEEHDRRNVFDVDLLAGRLMDATAWLRGQADVAGLDVGYFGASTGAAAALVAEARGAPTRAIVSRGGRPDLAGASLSAVWAPTLLIVGGDDTVVLELNREAQGRLRCTSELTVIPGATHLFEEPGTLHDAAIAARDWFVAHLGEADILRRERAADLRHIDR